MEQLARYTAKELEAIYMRHADTVYRACFLYMKSHSADLEDAVQNTFLKLMRSGRRFESAEHEKAWLIVTAGSVCKNVLKTAWRRRVVLKDSDDTLPSPEQTDDTLACVMALPNKYKTAVYLHYYEGYSGEEIAAMTDSKASTVYSLLHRGRKLLYDMIKEDEDEAR